MAENNEGEDGALPCHKSLGVGGAEPSGVPHALFIGEDLKARQGCHSFKGACGLHSGQQVWILCG